VIFENQKNFLKFFKNLLLLLTETLKNYGQFLKVKKFLNFSFLYNIEEKNIFKFYTYNLLTKDKDNDIIGL
jgi:hypothetical protein